MFPAPIRFTPSDRPAVVNGTSSWTRPNVACPGLCHISAQRWLGSNPVGAVGETDRH